MLATHEERKLQGRLIERLRNIRKFFNKYKDRKPISGTASIKPIYYMFGDGKYLCDRILRDERIRLKLMKKHINYPDTHN